MPNEGDYIDVHLWHLEGSGLRLATLGAQIVVLVFLAFVTWPGHSRHLPDGERMIYRLGEGGVILCGMLLLSPMSSKYHFVTLLVPISICLGDFLYRKRDPFVGAALVIILMLGTVTAKTLIGKSTGDAVGI